MVQFEIGDIVSFPYMNSSTTRRVGILKWLSADGLRARVYVYNCDESAMLDTTKLELEAHGKPKDTNLHWQPKIGDIVVCIVETPALFKGTAYCVAKVIDKNIELRGITGNLYNASRYFRPATPDEAAAFIKSDRFESADFSHSEVHEVVACVDSDGYEAIYVDGTLASYDNTLHLVDLVDACKDKTVRLSHRVVDYQLDDWPNTLAELDKWLQDQDETGAEKPVYRDVNESDIGKEVETRDDVDPDSWFDVRLMHVLQDGDIRFVVEDADGTRYVVKHARVLVTPETELTYREPTVEDLANGPIDAEFNDSGLDPSTWSTGSKLTAVMNKAFYSQPFVEERQGPPLEFFQWRYCRIAVPKT